MILNVIFNLKLIKDLEYFSKDIDFFPKREILTYDYLAESTEISNDRISCLNKIYNKKTKIIVTTIEAASQEIISRKNLYKNVLKLKEGESINLEELKLKLTGLGYKREELVEARSQYSVRGGIIDIAISNENGIRIELWGDEIDSIREFNISSQRSSEALKTVTIYPATEFILEDSLENNAKNEMLTPKAYQTKYEGDYRKEKIGQVYELYQKRF